MPEAVPPQSSQEQAQEEDLFELLFARGITDGLPVVPPTAGRVTQMLAAVERDPQEVLGTLGPNYGRATVEKVAVNAVMAGCRPSYFPVEVASVEALCEEKFDAHGINVTTSSATPFVTVNGPIRHQIGLNCGHNALGHGFRANTTIGRTLRLLILNVGGARPQEICKATLGHPAQFTFCVGETVILFGALSPVQINDHASRTAEQLALSIGWTIASVWNHKSFPLFSDMTLVVCPEQARTFAQDGWSKSELSVSVRKDPPTVTRVAPGRERR